MQWALDRSALSLLTQANWLPPDTEGRGEGEVTVLQGLRRGVLMVLFGGLAVGLTASLSAELRTGVVRLRGGMRIARRNHPTMYWLALVVQILFLVGCLYGLVRLIPHLLP